MPTFTTTFTPPAAPTELVITSNVASSKIELSWQPTLLGIDFARYSIYRSSDLGVTWREIGSNEAEADVEFDDYEAPLDVPLLYRVSVWNTTGFESDPPAEGSTELDVAAWWLVTPGNDQKTFELRVVTGYDDQQPLQEERYEPLGRDRKLVVMGELLGVEGKIDVDLSREDAALVQMIREASVQAGEYVLIKSPFGEVFRSHVGQVRRSRGTAARQRVTFEFVEVA